MGRLTTHVLDTARGRPAEGIKIALYRVSGNLALVRWDLSLPARPDNLVLMTIPEAEEHLHHRHNPRRPDRLEVLRGTHPGFVAFVEAVLRDAAGEFGVRSDVRL